MEMPVLAPRRGSRGEWRVCESSHKKGSLPGGAQCRWTAADRPEGEAWAPAGERDNYTATSHVAMYNC